MSELAFNLNGERFELPAAAAFWRVRRLKDVPRGGPEVVFGKDGVPLVIPVDTDIETFRQHVDYLPGRYRLDPVDERHKALDGVPAAYIQVARGPGPRNGGAMAGDPSAPLDERDAVIKEVVRANAEMVKVIAEKFAAVMQSAADLLRAADGAGLPRREPPPAELRNADVDDDDEDDDDEETDDRSALLQFLSPVVQLAVSHIMGKGANGSGVRNAADDDDDEDEEEDGEGEGAAPAAKPMNGARAPKVELMVQLAEIEKLLEPGELTAVRAAVGKLPPAEMKAWSERVCSVSPEEAVELIRAELAKAGKEGAGR